MATPTFCSVCDRNVYVADGDDFVCPVCSSPIPDTTKSIEADPTAALSEYYLG